MMRVRSSGTPLMGDLAQSLGDERRGGFDEPDRRRIVEGDIEGALAGCADIGEPHPVGGEQA